MRRKLIFRHGIAGTAADDEFFTLQPKFCVADCLSRGTLIIPTWLA
jgi:hypothetical protein